MKKAKLEDAKEDFLTLSKDIDQMESKIDAVLTDCSNRDESIQFLLKKRSNNIENIRKRNETVQKYAADLIEISQSFEEKRSSFQKQIDVFDKKYASELPALELKYEKLCNILSQLNQKQKLLSNYSRDSKIKLTYHLTDLSQAIEKENKAKTIIECQPNLSNTELEEEVNHYKTEIPKIRQQIADTEVKIENHNIALSKIRTTSNWRIMIKALMKRITEMQSRMDEIKAEFRRIKANYREAVSTNADSFTELSTILREIDEFHESADLNRRCFHPFSKSHDCVSVEDAKLEYESLKIQETQLKNELSHLQQEISQIDKELEEKKKIPQPEVNPTNPGTFSELREIKEKIKDEIEEEARLCYRSQTSTPDKSATTLQRQQIKLLDSMTLELKNEQQQISKLRVEVEQCYWQQNVLQAEKSRITALISRCEKAPKYLPPTPTHQAKKDEIARLERLVRLKRKGLISRPGGLYSLFQEELTKWSGPIVNNATLLQEWSLLLDQINYVM